MDRPHNRTIVITGSTGGIGLQSALGIARTGARVVLIGRNFERGETARKGILNAVRHANVDLVTGDVSSVAGIDTLARAVLAKVDRIDGLVNNAGYLGNERRVSVDGLEMHFAVNVLAPWRLTYALLPALERAERPRVINVTGGDKPSPIDVHNLQAEAGFKGLMTYTHSKSILEAMSMALAQRLKPKEVTVNVVFPGRASTAMTRSLTSQGLPGAMKLMMPFFRLFFRDDGGASAATAARSTIWAATTTELDGVTGRYFDTNSTEQKLHPTAYDTRVQECILALLQRVSASPSD